MNKQTTVEQLAQLYNVDKDMLESCLTEYLKANMQIPDVPHDD